MKSEAIKIDPNKQTNNQDEKKESAVLLGLGREDIGKTGVGRELDVGTPSQSSLFLVASPQET